MLRIRSESYLEWKKAGIRRGFIDFLRQSGNVIRADRDPRRVLAGAEAGKLTCYEFDDQGYLSRIESPMGRCWRIRHTGQGEILRLETPSGMTLEITDAGGASIGISRNSRPVILMEWNEAGDPRQIAYADDSHTLVEYAVPGRPSRIVNRCGGEERFEYSGSGQLSCLLDANANRTTFEYGGWGSPTVVRWPDRTEEQYQYDSNGLVCEAALDGESIAEIGYDDDGRRTRIQFGDGAIASYQYAGSGALTAADTRTCTATFGYDGRGRPNGEQQDEFEIGYGYDGAGNLSEVIYPSGARVAFQYDGDGRPVEIRDWNGGVFTADYYRNDTGVRWKYPNACSTEALVNPSGLPASIAVRHKDAAVWRINYDYDQRDQDRVAVASDSRFGHRAYQYDGEGRVREALVAGDPRRTEIFYYDAAGNRISWRGNGSSYNELNQVTGQGSKGRCGYDGRGNLVVRKSAQPERRFSWDYAGRLVRTEYGLRDGSYDATGWLEFDYDGVGRRILKRAPDSQTRFVWAGDQMIAEITTLTGGEKTVREYLYFPGSWRPLAMRVNGEVFYYHTDRLGTPRLLTDGAGAKVWEADYEAFGIAALPSRKFQNPLRFPGHYLDEETGLHYAGQRYYSPTFGRYISRHPGYWRDGLNLYTYANNDPVNGVDPTGLESRRFAMRSRAPIAKVVSPLLEALGPGATLAPPGLALPPKSILPAIAPGAVQALNAAWLTCGLEQTHCCVKPALGEHATQAMLRAAEALRELIPDSGSGGHRPGAHLRSRPAPG